MQNTIVICGGFNPINYNVNFVNFLSNYEANILVFPTEKYAPYDSLNIVNFLQENSVNLYENHLIFIAFSAGVVGALGAGRLWQRKGREVLAILAFDGWGVPLIADFPIHCLSHDVFTHYSSCFWVKNQGHFVAIPTVSHQDIWRSPLSINGYYYSEKETKKITEIDFINIILKHYIKY